MELTTAKKSPDRRWLAGAAVAGLAIACVAGKFLWNTAQSSDLNRQPSPSAADSGGPPPRTSGGQAPAGSPESGGSDARSRRMVLGAWHDEYEGKRTLILNEDGTGTMIVELSGWKAAMCASRLTFHLEWSLEGGRLKKHTVSGEPESQVKMILSTYGNHVDEPILELTEDRLLLLDGNGKTRYDWRRAKAP
jgi:hypothetical protein